MEMNFSNAERAEVLTAALPYIKKYSGKVVVIKYGGNAMINPQLKEQVMEDIVLLWLIGVKVVLIHGGGPEINETMAKLGKKAEFVNGLRVTDKETVDIVQMVLAGKVNKTLVNLIQMKGGHAVGVSGIDGGILEARVAVQKEKITQVVFCGDFLLKTSLAELEQALVGKTFAKQDVQNALCQYPLEHYFGGITMQEVLDTMFLFDGSR